MVLKEKASYISKLENELNEIHAENEKLKDKLIVFELEHLGGTAGTAQLKTSFNNYNATNNFTNLHNHSNDRTMADSREINRTTNVSAMHHAYQLENSFGNGTGSQHLLDRAAGGALQYYSAGPGAPVQSHEYSIHNHEYNTHTSAHKNRTTRPQIDHHRATR